MGRAHRLMSGGNAAFPKMSSDAQQSTLSPRISASTNAARGGLRSMRILLENQGNNSSIAQFDQYGIPDSTLYTIPGAVYSYGGYFKSSGITQPSQHWLTWISSKTGYDTNNRPQLTYPYYFTPYLAIGTNATAWTYVNRTFQLPSGFPNVELGHSYSIDSPGSGSLYIDDVFFRQIPAPGATNWSTWIPFGSTWRFTTNTPPGNWFTATFNDSAWPVGTAKFGAGGGPTNIATRVAQLCPSYYFRKQFVAVSADIEEFLLSATCTDVSGTALYPLRVFLNGLEVQATIDTVTGQGNEVRYFDLAPFASLLHSGTNTLAVQVSNWWSDYDDVAFDLSLKAIPYHPAFPRLTLQGAGPAGTFLSADTPAGTIWQLQSCDPAPAWNWQLVQTFTNAAGGAHLVADTGQNGRLPPTNVPARFYRLVPF